MTKEEMLQLVIDKNGEDNYYTNWFKSLVRAGMLPDSALYNAMITAICSAEFSSKK